MTDFDERESAPTAALSTPGWTPEWALPNITLDRPIEAASYAALVPTTDERLRAIAVRRPAFKKFLSAFRDEFRNRVRPTIVMYREDAPPMVKTDVALGGFLDAVCISAIVAGHCNSSIIDGIVHSDAFDIYPWFPNPRLEGHLGVVTPAMIGVHSVDLLRPQPAPALGRRSLSRSAMDQPLLEAILARWRHCFADGNVNDQDLRLFRSLVVSAVTGFPWTKWRRREVG